MDGYFSISRKDYEGKYVVLTTLNRENKEVIFHIRIYVQNGWLYLRGKSQVMID